MGFLSAFNKKPFDPRQHPSQKLSAMIGAYLERLAVRGGSIEERSLTLIARSPATAVAQAVASQSEELRREQVTTRIIFARLAPFERLAELAAALELTAARDARSSLVRLVKTPALLHAHEQLVLGTSCCWTGDMLRRCEENRNGLDLWEEDAHGSVRLAQLAFHAIWAIGKPVPPRILASGKRVLTDRANVNPAVAAAGLASSDALRRLPGSPVTRH
jgi:hypothetical protein